MGLPTVKKVKVHAVQTLRDNYSYLLEDIQAHLAAVIDPAEAEPIIKSLETLNLKPVEIWVTHHHRDHTGGIAGLFTRYGKIPVYASRIDEGRIPHQNYFLEDNDTVEFAGERAVVISAPGHSKGHIVYYLPESGHAFVGDVIFGASCGKVFEGTYEQMYTSVSKIAALPPDTKLWCGHEYTLNNLSFALQVDPDNHELKKRIETESPPTVPLLLERELRTNPFMRCTDPAVQAFTGKSDPLQVFTELRRRKDTW